MVPRKTPTAVETLDVADELALVFLPLHKRALGTAFGTAVATVVVLVTVAHLTVVPAAEAPPLGLLSEYFYGYSVSWRGALIGGFWGYFAGFVAGWFLAFCRNFIIAVSIFLTRTRAELDESRDFLDHI